MSGDTKIAPSILAADFSRLGEQAAAAQTAGANYLHIDVMDGHFVPTITFGSLVVTALRPIISVPMDVHLMVEEPDFILKEFADAGADILVVHVEAVTHLHRTLDAIHKLGLRAGVAINPTTPLTTLTYALPQIDLVNVLTVDPGYAGQQFIGSLTPKIRQLRAMIDEGGYHTELEVDGGINTSTCVEVVRAGADVIVAGSAVFNKRASISENINALREALAQA